MTFSLFFFIFRVVVWESIRSCLKRGSKSSQIRKSKRQRAETLKMSIDYRSCAVQHEELSKCQSTFLLHMSLIENQLHICTCLCGRSVIKGLPLIFRWMDETLIITTNVRLCVVFDGDFSVSFVVRMTQTQHHYNTEKEEPGIPLATLYTMNHLYTLCS